MLQPGSAAPWWSFSPAATIAQSVSSDRDPALCAIGIHGQWIYIKPRTSTVIFKQSSQKTPLDYRLDHLNFANAWRQAGLSSLLPLKLLHPDQGSCSQMA